MGRDESVRGTRRGAAIAAIVWIALSVPAGVNAQSAGSLTLSNATALADAQAPDRLVAAARVAVAHAEVGVAGMLTNPTVVLGGSLNTAHFYTSIAVPLPLFGQREAARTVAIALESAARHDLDVTRLDVRFAAAVAWIDLWLSEQEAVLTAETAERAERLASVTAERFDSGAAPRLDVLRARAEALRLRAEADSAALAQVSAAARLALWVGRDASLPLRTSGDPATPAHMPSLETLLAHLDHHALMLAARTRTSAAEASVALERRRRWPVVGFEVGTSFFDPSLVNSPTQPVPAFADAHLAVSFEVPMFNLHGPLIARAQAGVGQTSMEALSVRRRLIADVTAALAELRAAEARARVQRSAVLPAAQEAADLALEAYRAGRVDITGVIAAQQAFAEARRAAYRADADLARADAMLIHAAGGTW